MSSRKDELVAMLAGMTKEDKKIVLAELAKEVVAENGNVQHVRIRDCDGRKIGYFVPPAAWIEFPLQEDQSQFVAEYSKDEGPGIPVEDVIAELKMKHPELHAEWQQWEDDLKAITQAQAQVG